MTDAPELKPCPFCGGPAGVKPDREGYGGYVGCLNLGRCIMPYRRYDKLDGPEATVEAWNARADTVAAMVAEARNAALEAAIDAIHYDCFPAHNDASEIAQAKRAAAEIAIRHIRAIKDAPNA